MRINVFLKLIMMLSVIGLLQTACSAEIRDWRGGDDDDDASYPDPYPYPDPSDPPSSTHPVPIPDLDTVADNCAVQGESTAYQNKDGYVSYYGYSKYMCYENQNYRWRTSCESNECNATKVFVHYMLTKSIGDNLTVHVEAFDNKHFDGYPVATVEVLHFNAKTGSHDSADLFLPPGEFYLRAFVSNDDRQPTPYQFEGMELVADRPMGVYGAVSGAEKVVVDAWGETAPLHIMIDKLFTKPGTEPATNSRLRLKLATDALDQVELGRSIYIELFESDDFGTIPTYSFEMSSSLLKVQGQEGKAEFISPNLDLGQYVVRAYLDGNGDKFHDAPELVSVYEELGAPKLVTFQQDHTQTLSLELKPAE